MSRAHTFALYFVSGCFIMTLVNSVNWNGAKRSEELFLCLCDCTKFGILYIHACAIDHDLSEWPVIEIQRKNYYPKYPIINLFLIVYV